MDIVYAELADDPDNNRANRIIWAADGYAERRVDDALQVIEELQSAQLGTNLAEVDTRAVRGYPIDADALMEKVAEEYGERARDRLYQIIRYMPPAQPEPCEDAVSRQAAIRACGGYMVPVGIIKALQPVTPKQRTGKWERHYSRPNVYADLCWHCSACGYYHADNWTNKFKYCPNCGAKMEGDAE
ncbi:MAG: hypothetical protein J6S50_00610 [Oscillospiraceae bacterium]|nr:hypothetical protein [Oscillospiraceae bacterium]MBO7727003.1 hypothetical protein [Oscillospiraceae bacterium]